MDSEFSHMSDSDLRSMLRELDPDYSDNERRGDIDSEIEASASDEEEEMAVGDTQALVEFREQYEEQRLKHQNEYAASGYSEEMRLTILKNTPTLLGMAIKGVDVLTEHSVIDVSKLAAYGSIVWVVGKLGYQNQGAVIATAILQLNGRAANESYAKSIADAITSFLNQPGVPQSAKVVLATVLAGGPAIWNYVSGTGGGNSFLNLDALDDMPTLFAMYIGALVLLLLGKFTSEVTKFPIENRSAEELLERRK